MSLFKILLGVFNLFRNSKRSSSCSVCKARCVYFILFIRLDHAGMVQSVVNTANGRSWERTDPRPRLHPQGRGLAAPGHPLTRHRQTRRRRMREHSQEAKNSRTAVTRGCRSCAAPLGVFVCKLFHVLLFFHQNRALAANSCAWT